jgi:hypothetical protein
MKNKRLASIVSSSLIVCALMIGSLASAQTQSTVLIVNIPFAFRTTMQELPAGRYRVIRESASSVRLEGDGSAGGSVLMHDASQSHVSERGAVVFNRYGDRYYLSQIWKPGEVIGLECAKSRAEKDILRSESTQAQSVIAVAIAAALTTPQH